MARGASRGTSVGGVRPPLPARSLCQCSWLGLTRSVALASVRPSIYLYVCLLWRRTVSCLQSNGSSCGIDSKARKVLEHSVARCCAPVSCHRARVGPLAAPCGWEEFLVPWHVANHTEAAAGCCVWHWFASFDVVRGKRVQPREWESWGLGWAVTPDLNVGLPDSVRELQGNQSNLNFKSTTNSLLLLLFSISMFPSTFGTYFH